MVSYVASILTSLIVKKLSNSSIKIYIKMPQKHLNIITIIIILSNLNLIDADNGPIVSSLIQVNISSPDKTSQNATTSTVKTEEFIGGNVKVGDDEFVFLQIIHPITPIYVIPAMSARIGSSFADIDKMNNIALVLAEPRLACSTIINKLEIRNNIALVRQGSCAFIQKCLEIERVGGAGLIIYNSDRHPDGDYIRMTGDSTSRNCSIPTANILGKDGHMLEQILTTLNMGRAVVTIPI